MSQAAFFVGRIDVSSTRLQPVRFAPSSAVPAVSSSLSSSLSASHSATPIDTVQTTWISRLTCAGCASTRAQPFGGLQRAPQRLAGAREHGVANAMAEGFVHLAEAVEVDQQQRGGLVGAGIAQDLALEHVLHPAPVVQPGEAVVARAGFECDRAVEADVQRGVVVADALGKRAQKV